jgi:uncharacterized protein (TIGR03546 family)
MMENLEVCMGLLLKQLFALLKLLNSETGENQIAAGVALGFILGMTPAFSLQSALVFLCLFLFRVQIGMAFLAACFFSFAAWALDPLFHQVGAFVLELGPLQALWTALYNLPIVPFTRFNNTIVMGSGVVSLLLSPCVFLLSRALVIRYRAHVVARLEQTKIWKAMKATSLYQWYYSYEKLYHR